MSLQKWERIFQRKTEKLPDNWRIEFDDSIVPDNPNSDWFQYIRGAFAKFKCCECKRTWASSRVLVVFHFQLQRGSRMGTVKAHRYRQNCKMCQEAEMEEPEFEPDNIDVLLEKLVEKIRIRCYKENLGENNRQFRPYDLHDGPHESSHCEACQKGICRKV